MWKAHVSLFAFLLAFAACSGDKGADGTNGTNGTDGVSCTVADNGDGTKTVTCTDGTTVTVNDGSDGDSCTVVDNGDGTKTITCEDGSSVTVGDGVSPLGPGETPGIDLKLTVAAPANSTHYVTGEQIVLTIVALDAAGNPLMLGDLSTLSLYMNGPRAPTKTVSSVGLLNSSTDRSVSDHHYVNLKTTTNTNLAVTNNQFVYTMAAVSSEDPGTYTIGVRGAVDGFSLDQTFPLLDVQIGTATAEPTIIGGCDNCHKGAANGQLYMHHVDPGFSPTGSPAIDSGAAPRTCKMCHNNEGYASIRKCNDGSYPIRIAGVYTCDDATENYVRINDPIINRAHGVHMGSGLLTAYNERAFADYLEVKFPADVKDCTSCHVTDAYKTNLSALACGTCHDQVNFTTGAMEPPKPSSTACTVATQASDCAGVFSGFNGTCNATSLTCELATHTGGASTACAACHGDGASAGVDKVHVDMVDTYAPEFPDITIAMTAPANTTHYEGSEAPVVTITAKNAAGTTLDATTVDGTWNRARFFVYGPTDGSKPVLTTAVASTSTYAYVDFRSDVDVVRSSTDWKYTLNAVSGLEAGTYTVMFMIRRASGSTSLNSITFQVGTATAEKNIAGNCGDCHSNERMHGSYPFEPAFCKGCHDYGLKDATTYTSWTDSNFGFGAGPLNRRIHRVHYGRYLDSQANHDYSAFIFPQDVRNCVKCHSETDSWKEKPSRMACLACHDSPAAVAHGTLMTVDPTPTTPWSGDEQESCATCHGPGKDYAVDKVHNITDPYVPPYRR